MNPIFTNTVHRRWDDQLRGLWGDIGRKVKMPGHLKELSDHVIASEGLEVSLGIITRKTPLPRGGVTQSNPLIGSRIVMSLDPHGNRDIDRHVLLHELAHTARWAEAHTEPFYDRLALYVERYADYDETLAPLIEALQPNQCAIRFAHRYLPGLTYRDAVAHMMLGWGWSDENMMMDEFSMMMVEMAQMGIGADLGHHGGKRRF